MDLPPEVTLSFDISFHPAQPGTKQFLEREQHVHKLYQNRHEQEEDFDLEATKSNASITNPGLVLSFDVNIGGKDFRFNVDNSHSHRILHVHEKELPSSSQKVKDVSDASKLPTVRAGSVSQHTDTCTLSGLSIPNFDFHVVSNSEKHDVQKLTDSVGFMGNFPDPSHEGLSGFAEYMLMHTISLTYERASGKDAKTKFSKGIVGLGELPPSVSSTVIYTAPSVKKQRKQYCDDLPFKLDLLYGLQETDSEALTQGGIAIWDHLRTFIMFPSDLFKKYTAAVGAELDEKTGLFTVTDEQYRKIKSLFFHIGEAKHELIPNAQIWPRDLNSILGGDEDKIYLSIVDSGVNSGKGFDIVLGYTFLQRFHLVVDAPNDRLGFGPSADTKAIFN